MPECPRCGHSTQGEARFCSRCGAELDFGVDSPTEIASSAPPRSHRSAGEILVERSRTPSSVLPGEDPRFVPGMVLANRYRIIGRLGRGGMGDVYRADDLKLGQSVALKFLPEEVSGDPERLRRFLAEVRIARQISHANVCRVYDVVEEGASPLWTGERDRLFLRQLGAVQLSDHHPSLQLVRPDRTVRDPLGSRGRGIRVFVDWRPGGRGTPSTELQRASRSVLMGGFATAVYAIVAVS